MCGIAATSLVRRLLAVAGSYLRFSVGAGDGNRICTISLGICAIRAFMCPELRGRLSVSVRERPVVTGANGTAILVRPDRWPFHGQARLTRPTGFALESAARYMPDLPIP
jgi:hypothetical protein